MRSSIADLGEYTEKPNFNAAMRAYIAMSRTTDAEGLLILRPFSQTLFGQGPQPWPSLLMQVLQNAMLVPALRAATENVVCVSLFIEVNALLHTNSERTTSRRDAYFWTSACAVYLKVLSRAYALL